ncbi:hypothetical protein [Trinickia dinghuensis]
MQKLAQRAGQAVVRAIRHEPHAAVDIPADDEDRALGSQQRLA